MSTYKVDNIRLVDTLIDDVDPTKKLKLSLANISTNTTRTLTVPNANTTIVGTDIVQTLTNKTITDPTNTVTATGLRTSTTAVSIAGSSAPTIGQILTATSNTAATWQTPSGLAIGGNLVDTNTFIVDDGNATKRLGFENAAASAGTTTTLAITQTANRVLTLPDITDTLVTRTNTETLTNKTLTAPSISTITNGGTLTLPSTTDTIVARNTVGTLTNKTITDVTNNVTANNLRTTGADVIISGAAPPTTGQVLTSTSATAANWQTPSSGGSLSVYLNNNGTVSNPALSTLKQWYGYSTSVSGIATFNVTTDGTAAGPAIFTNLNGAFFQSTGRVNTTGINAAFCSIQKTTGGKQVLVNVRVGNSGSILIGGSYQGMANAPDGTESYLYIIGS